MSAEPMRMLVGLLDGSEFSGRMRSFRPQTAQIVLEAESPADDSPSRRCLPVESVAYVAVCSDDAHVDREIPNSALRVHVGHGRSFLVEPISDPHDLFGFWGLPLEGSAGFERIYFFAHARRALERSQPLGSILVGQGMVGAEDLERGLDHQAALRRRRVGEILLEQKRIEPQHLDEGLALQRRRRIRLGEVLVEAGLASSEDIETALEEQRRHRGRRIGEILVDMGVVGETTLARTLAEKFHLPFLDLDDCVIDPKAVCAVPRRLLEADRILPIEISADGLTVALSDPLNTEALDLIRFQRSSRVREVVAVPSQIERYLRELLAAGARDDAAEVAALAEGLELDTGEEHDDDSHSLSESDNTIIQLANQILVEAIRRGASDVHIEPNGDKGPVEVRFRVDGGCVSLPSVPSTHRHALVSRLKIMAQLDIAERRRPQDGKIRVRMPGQTVELRMATMPTIGGEDIVLRVLSASQLYSLDALGLDERDREMLERMVLRPHGLVLCVGPTGSGKSTTLHSLLGHINTPARKIWTAEDPVEITQPGLRQVPVHPKIGFGFAEALRSFLRADPDVIMIGEMRDLETARTAVEASLTGHLVLSTLHTNSAAETIGRLVEMGVDPFSFGDSLLGVLAQRLVRRLCESCRSLEPASDADVDELRAILGEEPDQVGKLLWEARGCRACQGSGYRGRAALHELLVCDERIRSAIHAQHGTARIRELAAQGGTRTLLQQGARRCLDGTTDLRQVIAVCPR